LSFALFCFLKKIYFLFYLRLQETVPKSSSLSVAKKVIIGVAVACLLIIIIGGVLGGVLSHEGSERKCSKFNKRAFQNFCRSAGRSAVQPLCRCAAVPLCRGITNLF
jgi:uncharacterized membrane protein YraQ (UPF0718 family)